MATLGVELGFMVYDTAAGRIVPIAARHLKFTFDDKPHKSARLYSPCDGIVWTPDNNVWLMQPRGVPLADVRPRMTSEEKKRATLVNSHLVHGSRRDKPKEADLEGVLDTIGRQLNSCATYTLLGTQPLRKPSRKFFIQPR